MHRLSLVLMLVSGNVVTVTNNAIKETDKTDASGHLSNEERSRNATVDANGVLRIPPPSLPDPLIRPETGNGNVGESM